MTVVVQMGHVPRRSGATGAPGEQTYARGVAARAEPLLRQAGFDARVIYADPLRSDYRGDLFVAVHYDGSVHQSARGASVGHQTPEGHGAAATWKHAYQRRGFAGGFRPDNYTPGLAGYYGVRQAVAEGNRRAFIVEGGFGSHPQEGPWLQSDTGMQTCAVAIRDTAIAVLGKPDDEKEGVFMALSEQQQREIHTWVGQARLMLEQTRDATGRLERAARELLVAEVARIRADTGRDPDAGSDLIWAGRILAGTHDLAEVRRRLAG